MTGMDWFLWFLVGWWLLSIIVTVAFVGQPRKPITAGTGAYLVAIDLAFIAGLLVTR